MKKKSDVSDQKEAPVQVFLKVSSHGKLGIYYEWYSTEPCQIVILDQPGIFEEERLIATSDILFDFEDDVLAGKYKAIRDIYSFEEIHEQK